MTRLNPNTGTTYAPKVFAEDADAEGVRKEGFRAAMQKLFRDGKIQNVIEHEGTTRERRYLAVVSGAQSGTGPEDAS